MNAVIQNVAETGQVLQEQCLQSDCIVRLLQVGDMEAALGKDAEATRTYYSIFQPGLYGEPVSGLRRVAPIRLYAQAAQKLRAVARRYAEQLSEKRCFLAGDTVSGIVGVPRGALNLYLISNQYELFAECALRYAAEESTKRDIKRFLMSSVRARLNHLRAVQGCATLLEEEQDAVSALAGFEATLRAHLAPVHPVPCL